MAQTVRSAGSPYQIGKITRRNGHARVRSASSPRSLLALSSIMRPASGPRPLPCLLAELGPQKQEVGGTVVSFAGQGSTVGSKVGSVVATVSCLGRFVFWVDLIWFGLLWLGLAWLGLAWFGFVLFGLV
eukprot:gene8847-biopygen13704